MAEDNEKLCAIITSLENQLAESKLEAEKV